MWLKRNLLTATSAVMANILCTAHNTRQAGSTNANETKNDSDQTEYNVSIKEKTKDDWNSLLRRSRVFFLDSRQCSSLTQRAINPFRMFAELIQRRDPLWIFERHDLGCLVVLWRRRVIHRGGSDLCKQMFY